MAPHENQSFTCDICSKSFVKMKYLKTHKKLLHSDKIELPYECEVYKKRFITPSQLNAHKPKHTGETPFECDFCKKKFRYVKSFKAHKITHTEGRKRYKCPLCTKHLATSESLKSHIMIHENSKSFVCEICSKAFVSTLRLKEHKRIHLEKKPYECKTCGKGFLNAFKLNIHMRSHTGERPVECDICKKRVSSHYIMKKHIIAHMTNGIVYKCPICAKKCMRKKNFQFHIQSHTEVKPFECEICKKRFSKSDDLNSHKTIHEERKSFGYDVCSRSFVRKRNLTNQKKLQLDEKTLTKSKIIQIKHETDKIYLPEPVFETVLLKEGKIEENLESISDAADLSDRILIKNKIVSDVNTKLMSETEDIGNKKLGNQIGSNERMTKRENSIFVFIKQEPEDTFDSSFQIEFEAMKQEVEIEDCNQ